MSILDVIPVRRLDQAFALWEEAMWGFNVLQKGVIARDGQKADIIPPLVGPVVHYKDFRRHLLRLSSIDEFDYGRFNLRSAGGAPWEEGTLQFVMFPSQIAAWTCNSRRAYHLDADLQAILSAMKLDDLTLADIHFPFESFGISLDEPIVSEKGVRYNFILFAPIREEVTVGGQVRKTSSISLFGSDIDEHRFIPREQIDKKVARGRFIEAGELMAKKSAGSNDVFNTFAFYNEKYAGQLTDLLQGDIAITQAYRILFGLMLYLRMMADARTAVLSPWCSAFAGHKKVTSPDKRAITDESQICSVRSVRSLSSEERSALYHFARGGVSGREMPYHFREGHYRRPPGTGHNPLQAKTVMVQPTVVRQDRKPLYGVAGGGIVRVKQGFTSCG